MNRLEIINELEQCAGDLPWQHPVQIRLEQLIVRLLAELRNPTGDTSADRLIADTEAIRDRVRKMP